ncbi:uncharacterized protein EI97DRAFT_93248 [Westerdykella ornata]|uniref:Uncharacterized protein n=1 Tax=Westerdykella ornata TaxID=318751 RepID=A0A6A6JF14_WESOR|nr:uncharacterized protein EI97DRAFT_93248 [Westerdykella ornata]KAF2274897.1 hypothetical protein EI97DRAFT_93248 [Westerdykella ornata]
MEKIKHKVEQVLHKDRDTTTTSGTTHAGGDPSGPHRTHLGNVADPRDSDRPGGYGNTASAGGTTHTGFDSGTTGTTGYGSTTHTGTGLTGSTGTHAGTGLTGSTGHSTNAGPHSSNIANKLDPRYDSDRDNSATLGGGPGYGTHTGTGLTTSTGTHTGTGLTGSTGHSTNAGPHSTNIGNVLDPRIDSDRDGSHTVGGYGSTTGTGYGTHTGSHTGAGLTGSTGTHTGTGQHTAGPHKSDFLNKVDPTVDSDLDGSKTLGTNRTY